VHRPGPLEGKPLAQFTAGRHAGPGHAAGVQQATAQGAVARRAVRREADAQTGRALGVLASLTDGPVVRRILEHLKQPDAPPPLAPARGPPQHAFWH
jgi:hypothetical protein